MPVCFDHDIMLNYDAARLVLSRKELFTCITTYQKVRAEYLKLLSLSSARSKKPTGKRGAASTSR